MDLVLNRLFRLCHPSFLFPSFHPTANPIHLSPNAHNVSDVQVGNITMSNHCVKIFSICMHVWCCLLRTAYSLCDVNWMHFTAVSSRQTCTGVRIQIHESHRHHSHSQRANGEASYFCTTCYDIQFMTDNRSVPSCKPIARAHTNTLIASSTADNSARLFVCTGP